MPSQSACEIRQRVRVLVGGGRGRLGEVAETNGQEVLVALDEPLHGLPEHLWYGLGEVEDVD